MIVATQKAGVLKTELNDLLLTTYYRAVKWEVVGVDISPFYRIFGKKSFLRGCFILSLAIECMFILMLIVGEFRTSPQPLSAEEVGRYTQYSILLPNHEECYPDAANVLAQCAFQEEKSIGDRQYKFYTSAVLPQYIYQCDSIREIMETDTGTVYITYVSRDAEEVTLTIGNSGIIRKDIYAEKTDTYYVLSELENYKFPHYRNPHFSSPIIKILAGGLGFILALIFIVSKVRSHKKEK